MIVECVAIVFTSVTVISVAGLRFVAKMAGPQGLAHLTDENLPEYRAEKPLDACPICGKSAADPITYERFHVERFQEKNGTFSALRNRSKAERGQTSPRQTRDGRVIQGCVDCGGRWFVRIGTLELAVDPAKLLQEEA